METHVKIAKHRKGSTAFADGLGNYGLGAKSGPVHVFINKVLLEKNSYSFIHLWLFYLLPGLSS